MGRSFNGTTALGSVGGNVTNPGIEWSVGGWLKAASGANSNADIYSEGLNSNTNPFVQILISPADKCASFFRADGGGTSDSFTSTASIAIGAWVHILLTQTTGNLISLYVNGVLDSTFTRTGNSNGTTTLDRIGFAEFITNGGSKMVGSLGQWASWTRKLSAQEAKSLASGLTPSHLGPTHYWQIAGIDSPEPDVGIGTHVAQTVVGSPSAVSGPPVGLSLLKLAA